MSEEKHTGGRPPIFESSEQLKDKIDEYFEYIKGEWYWKAGSDEDGKPIDVKEWERHPEACTITGLALFLGFESRQSFYDYSKKPEFSYIIKNAQFRVEHEYEKSALNAKNPTFHIFALKNMGWKDKTEVENTNLNITTTEPPLSIEEAKRKLDELNGSI
jgi:hypothetical protein